MINTTLRNTFAVATLAAWIALSPLRADASGATTWGVLTRFETNSNGLVVQTTATGNPDGCTNLSGYEMPRTAANYDSAERVLLAAQLSGRDVSFWVHLCTPSGRPQIRNVYLR